MRRASIPAAGYLRSYTHPPGPPFPDQPTAPGAGRAMGLGTPWTSELRDGVEKNGRGQIFSNHFAAGVPLKKRVMAEGEGGSKGTGFFFVGSFLAPRV